MYWASCLLLECGWDRILPLLLIWPDSWPPTSQLPTTANCCDWWRACRIKVPCCSPCRFPALRRHLQSCQPSRGASPDRPHWPSCPRHRATCSGHSDGRISQVSALSFILAFYGISIYSLYLKKIWSKTNIFFLPSNYFLPPNGNENMFSLLGALSYTFIFITVEDGESQLVGVYCWWWFNASCSQRKLVDQTCWFDSATRECL